MPIVCKKINRYNILTSPGAEIGRQARFRSVCKKLRGSSILPQGILSMFTPETPTVIPVLKSLFALTLIAGGVKHRINIWTKLRFDPLFY